MTTEHTFNDNKEKNCTFNNIEKGLILYYARVVQNCGIYDVVELKVRTVTSDYFVGVETNHTKQAFLLGYNTLDVTVFKNRKDALKFVKEKEKNSKKVSQEHYYDEY